MIKGSLILVLTFGVSRLLGRRSAAERHLVWTVALGLAALLPLLSVLLPAWQPDLARRAASVLPVLARVTGPADSPFVDEVVIRAESVESQASTLVNALQIIWFFGAGLVLLATLKAGRRLARCGAAATTITDPDWRTLVADVSRSLGRTRAVDLRQSARGSVPVTWGFWRPRVLLPACAAQWTDERKRLVLAHELAHVSRGDWLVQVAAKLLCAVYWFNPLFWMAYGQLCLESEQACDDAVLGLGVDRREYATHLLEIARELTPEQALAPALAMARPSSLERRFVALLSGASNRSVPTPRLAGVVAFVMLLAVLPLAAVGIPAAHATIHIRTAGLPALPEAVGSAEPTAVPAIRDVRASVSNAAGGAVAPPSVIEYSTPPLYSDEARSRRIEGVVSLEVAIDAAGHAEVVRVLKGLGFGLDENARLAVRHWRFAAATRHGLPIESTTAIDIPFSLATEAINELIANDMATRVGPGITPPRIVRRVAVQHAPTQRAGSTGVVLLDVVLLEDGTPKIVRITRSIDPMLDQEAVRAFEQWRFSPAMKDGRPVKVRMNAEVRFHLE